MKFLIDNNLSPRMALALTTLGCETIHVADVGLASAPDELVLNESLIQGAVLITADSDFPEMLALSGAMKPSVIYLTGDYPTEPGRLAIFIFNQLPVLEESLNQGAVIAIDGRRARIRMLPI